MHFRTIFPERQCPNFASSAPALPGRISISKDVTSRRLCGGPPESEAFRSGHTESGSRALVSRSGHGSLVNSTLELCLALAVRTSRFIVRFASGKGLGIHRTLFLFIERTKDNRQTVDADGKGMPRTYCLPGSKVLEGQVYSP